MCCVFDEFVPLGCKAPSLTRHALRVETRMMTLLAPRHVRLEQQPHRAGVGNAAGHGLHRV